MILCPFCGEPEYARLFEVWDGRDFQIETCCEGSHEAIAFEIAHDPAGAAAWLRDEGIETAVGHQLRRVVDVDEHLVLDWRPDVRPIAQAAAKAFVRDHHEHCPPPAGWRYGAGVWNGPDLLGVVMVGRPVARALDHTKVVEVNRLCLDRDMDDQLRHQAASTLYRWAADEAGKRGYTKIITYTLESESGMSLRYARWKPEKKTKGGSWDTPARRRNTKAPTVRKVRWAGPIKTAA